MVDLEVNSIMSPLFNVFTDRHHYCKHIQVFLLRDLYRFFAQLHDYKYKYHHRLQIVLHHLHRCNYRHDHLSHLPFLGEVKFQFVVNS